MMTCHTLPLQAATLERECGLATFVPFGRQGVASPVRFFASYEALADV
jgi:hypothetical protein